MATKTKARTISTKPLGTTQEAVLKSLRRYKQWRKKGGWMWESDRKTAEILESLVKRGLVTRRMERGVAIYRPREG